jgi:excisionase family DNA binding protein
MNKFDAAKFLGIGVRSLERYTSEKRITPVKIKGKTGPVLDYTDADLERLKIELMTPVIIGEVESAAEVPPPSSAKALARLPREPRQIESSTPAKQRPSVPTEHKLLLTLDEAQAMTGLSRAFLRADIAEGRLLAGQIGRSWRIRRDDLKSYLEGLF